MFRVWQSFLAWLTEVSPNGPAWGCGEFAGPSDLEPCGQYDYLRGRPGRDQWQGGDQNQRRAIPARVTGQEGSNVSCDTASS